MGIKFANAVALSERIRDHLTKQRKVSIVEGLGCAYRGADGTMCAVGCLIKDEHYSTVVEGAAVVSQWRDDKLPEDDDKNKSIFALKDALTKSLGRVPTAIDMKAMKLWQEYHDGHYFEHWVKYGVDDESPDSHHETVLSLLEGEFGTEV